MEANGVQPGQVEIAEEALRDIIQHYTGDMRLKRLKTRKICWSDMAIRKASACVLVIIVCPRAHTKAFRLPEFEYKHDQDELGDNL